MSDLRLYEISTEMRAYLDALDEDEDTDLRETLAALEQPFTDKARAVAFYIREREAQAAARTAEAERLRKLAQSDAGVVTRLKAYLRDCMLDAGLTKIEGVIPIRVQQNPPAVTQAPDVGAETVAVWPQFVRVPEAPAPTWDKKALLDAHKAQAPLPDGVVIERGLSVRIG